MRRYVNHVVAISRLWRQRKRHPLEVGPVEREVVFLLDGVGGYQSTVVRVRQVLRELGDPIGSVIFDWQTACTGEIFSDLTWLRRNRVMGARLARRIRAFQRSYPGTPVHIFALSGGAGIAAFACAYLRPEERIETLLLGCPALSPTYDLSPALRGVHRAYALVSRRDSFFLGLGTRLFGTTDRVRTDAAGRVGFLEPGGEAAATYDGRLRQLHWEPSLAALGHHGGHLDWLQPTFLRAYLMPMLRGEIDRFR
jgi:pimeloyl-ACP methyl ester carboxylesterase